MWALIKRAFTIMEVMTVVIIVGVIAVFAIPNFSKTMTQSHEQDTMTQMTALHAANEIYRAQNGGYWPPDASTYNLAAINSALGLSILSNGMNYGCVGNTGAGYTCTANRPSGDLIVVVTEAALSATNPQVTSSCPYGCL